MDSNKLENIIVWIALLVASAASATAFSVVSADFRFWPFAFIVAFLHAVSLGILAYIVCKARKWTQWWVSLVCGFAIGALPSAYLSIGLVFGFTWERLIEDINFLVSAGLLGMVGGFSAWLVWKLGFMLARKDT